MGVIGLWSLLEPAGKPVSLESLENKILAIGKLHGSCLNADAADATYTQLSGRSGRSGRCLICKRGD